MAQIMSICPNRCDKGKVLPIVCAPSLLGAAQFLGTVRDNSFFAVNLLAEDVPNGGE